jgi:hypothetical protein
MWGYAIPVVLALFVAAGPVLAETQSVIDPTQVPLPPKAPATAPKKPTQPNLAVQRERERAAVERRKREEAESRAQAAANEAARLRAAEQARQAADAARAKAAAATKHVTAARTRADDAERRKRQAAEARAQAAERETAKLRAAEQSRLEQEAAMAAAERQTAAARMEAIDAERRKREAAEARAQAAEKEVEKLRVAEQERRAAEQERRELHRRAAEAEKEATMMATSEWTQRLALLERLRGQLTLARALAILLDVNQKDEYAMLLELETSLRQDPWHSAYAMSVNQIGQLAAGRGWRSRTPELAAVTAVSFCNKGGGESCRSVMVNGKFQEDGFLEVARQVGKLNVVAVRTRYFKALRASGRESSPWAYQPQEPLPLSRLDR